ncbi:MAG: L-threonylcarbamoyladenylate synthase, partial [Gammaproteobacteria bacterium]
QPAAVAAVFAIKGRPGNHPLIVHVADAAAARQWAADWPEAAARLAAAFWPGPLTLVVPRGAAVLSAVTGGQDTVALRVPQHPLAQAVLRQFAGAVVAPSANRYGRLSPTRAADVIAEFGPALPVLDGGECSVGLESTIVACLRNEVRVLRPGILTPTAISRVTGTEVIVGAGEHDPRVPGAVKAHYAPRAPLELVPLANLAARLRHCPQAAVVVRQSPDGEVPGQPDRIRVLPADPLPFGRMLYATLRDLDALEVPRVLVVEPPAGEAWAAVRDRLVRAAAAGGVDSTGDAPHD